MGDAESPNKTAADDCVDCEDDQPTSAVACCENCAKCMCAKHVDNHSKLKSCRHHVVVPLTGTKPSSCHQDGTSNVCRASQTSTHWMLPQLQQSPRMHIVPIRRSQYPQGLPIATTPPYAHCVHSALTRNTMFAHFPK